MRYRLKNSCFLFVFVVSYLDLSVIGEGEDGDLIEGRGHVRR